MQIENHMKLKKFWILFLYKLQDNSIIFDWMPQMPFMDMNLYLTQIFIMQMYYLIQNSEWKKLRNSERKKVSAGEHGHIYTENSS